MGCCSNCFNPNKKEEKDNKNIQNISISDHEPKEYINNKKEYQSKSFHSYNNVSSFRQ